MKNPKIANFYHSKPVFGLDIGHGSLKAMQLADQADSTPGKPQRPQVLGYGFATFDKSAQQDGVVVKPEIIAKAAYNLFKNELMGDIRTRRVAIAIPAYRTFTRAMQLPKLPASQLKEAVELEAEQYISLPLNELYLDYETVRQTPENTELFVVAVPRTIVDSYLELTEILGLETVLIEPTLSSSGRLFSITDNSEESSFIIDLGSLSSDISIVDRHRTLVMGTVQGGGTNFTEAIRTGLKVTPAEAALIKSRYGLGVSKRQAEIRQALEPILEAIIKEIRRMMRYYEEHYGSSKPIKQVITMGGGANMPGLSEYFIQSLRLASRHVDPWQYFDYKGLQPPSAADKPMYATVAGLSLTHPKEVF